MKKLTVRINGEERSTFVANNDTLLDCLRENFGVMSPKCGCYRGDCGACAVLLDGKSVRSCLILAIEVDGQDIETVEGISENGLTQIQKKMVEMNAFQCGFCAPGVVVSATELIRKNPNPTKEDVQEALSGNLCRCTGYVPIIDSILAASGGKK